MTVQMAKPSLNSECVYRAQAAGNLQTVPFLVRPANVCCTCMSSICGATDKEQRMLRTASRNFQQSPVVTPVESQYNQTHRDKIEKYLFERMETK